MVFDMLNPITLHPYQKDAVFHSMMADFNNEFLHLLELPTGSGKTIIALWLIREVIKQGGNGLFLVPRKDLVKQTQEDALEHFFHPWEVGIVRGESNETDRKLTIATVQTLTTNPDRLYQLLKAQRRKFDIIVADECHFAISETWQHVFEQALAQDGQLKGLTATPYRSDNISLLRAFPDGLKYSIDFLDLILLGFLVPVEAYDRETTADFSDLDVDEEEKAVLERQLDSDRYQVAYDSWMQLARGKRTLIFAQDLSDAYRFQEYMQAKKIECPVVNGNTPDSVREEYYNRLRSGDLLMMSGYNVFTTGLDIKEIECIIIGRPTRFRGLFTQIVGRGLRTAPHIGKEKLILINLTDQQHTLLSMQKLIGLTDITKPVSVKRALEEKMEESEPSFEAMDREPNRLYNHLREIHLRASDVFAGNGWVVNRSTGDYERDYGDSILRAEKVLNGYHIVQYLKRGDGELKRPKQITDTPLPAEIALARGNAFMERHKIDVADQEARREAHQSLLDGESPDMNLPITPGMYSYLIEKRKLRFDKHAARKMKQGDYAQIVNFLNTHGSAFPKSGERMWWTPTKGFYTWKVDPPEVKEKKGTSDQPEKTRGGKKGSQTKAS